MSQHFTVYFKGADGVHPAKLPASEALSATRKFPHQWSLTRVFADPPEGRQPSEGNGGGRGRIAGASVRAD
jgi:hypothetical protein